MASLAASTLNIEDESIFADLNEGSIEPEDTTLLAEEINNIHNDKREINIKNEPNVKKAVCYICNHKCKTNDKLMQHIRKTHKGLNPFQCSICEYSAYQKTRFEEHVNSHKGIRPHKCSVCDYASVSKKYLKQHESKHVKCTLCSFMGKSKTSLRAHLYKEHIKQKSFTCDICSVKLSTKSSLSKHLLKKHFRCIACDLECSSKADISAHCRNNHKIVYNKHFSNKKTQLVKHPDFICAVCSWPTSNKPKALLHLIHHPNQVVDEKKLDITILRKYGIME